MAPVRRASRAPGGEVVADRLRDALLWWRTFLRHASPRRLHFMVPEPPLIIFVDGACEIDFFGVGALIVDRRLGLCEAFGAEVPRYLVDAVCASTGSQRIIAQLELLPVLLATWVWAASLAPPGRRVIVFIDNDSARYALIRGYSPVAASRVLVEQTWQQLARAQAAPWFERVPSTGNPADAPSRGDRQRLFRDVPGARWREDALDGPRLRELACMIGGGSGSEGRAPAPAQGGD